MRGDELNSEGGTRCAPMPDCYHAQPWAAVVDIERGRRCPTTDSADGGNSSREEVASLMACARPEHEVSELGVHAWLHCARLYWCIFELGVVRLLMFGIEKHHHGGRGGSSARWPA
ncbi:hypothetical protein Dimus_024786 [Dionaea muscipula]